MPNRRYQRTAQRITSAGKRKPRNTRAVVMGRCLGAGRDGERPVLPAHGPPLNATDPGDAAPLAASPQRAEPESGHMVPEASQRPMVGRDRMVGEVAGHDPLQPCPLRGDRLMPTPSQPLLDFPEPCLHAVASGLPLDEEAAP